MVIMTDVQHPEALGSASLNRHGEVDTLHIDAIVITDRRSGEIIVSHSINATIDLEVPQAPASVQEKLLDLLWLPDQLVSEGESDYNVPFLDPTITSAIINDFEVEFTLAGKAWFKTGKVPIRDLGLTPSLFVDVLVRACIECGKE